MADTNSRLALQRKPFFDYLDANPDERGMFIRAALAEGGTRGLLTNFEQMMNYGNARGFTNTHEIVYSGFFGPVNRGEAQQHVITEEEAKLADAALEQVKLGSNVLDYRTDQGMRGDPNYDREQQAVFRPVHIAGNFFADHPMFGVGSRSWAARQIALDHDLLPPTSQPANVKVTTNEAAMNPLVSVPLSSTPAIISQSFQKLLSGLQAIGAGIFVAFAEHVTDFNLKGVPAWVAIAGVAGIEIYKHYWLKESNEATREIVDAFETKLNEAKAVAKS